MAETHIMLRVTGILTGTKQHDMCRFTSGENQDGKNQGNVHTSFCEKRRFIRILVKFSAEMPDVRTCQQTLIKTFFNDVFMRREIMKCMRMSRNVRNFELLRLLEPSPSGEERIITIIVPDPLFKTNLKAKKRDQKDHGVFEKYHNNAMCKISDRTKQAGNFQSHCKENVAQNETDADDSTYENDFRATENIKLDMGVLLQILEKLSKRSKVKSCNTDGYLASDEGVDAYLYDRPCYEECGEEVTCTGFTSDIETKPIQLSSEKWVKHDKLGSCEPLLEIEDTFPANDESNKLDIDLGFATEPKLLQVTHVPIDTAAVPVEDPPFGNDMISAGSHNILVDTAAVLLADPSIRNGMPSAGPQNKMNDSAADQSADLPKTNDMSSAGSHNILVDTAAVQTADSSIRNEMPSAGSQNMIDSAAVQSSASPIQKGIIAAETQNIVAIPAAGKLGNQEKHPVSFSLAKSYNKLKNEEQVTEKPLKTEIPKDKAIPPRPLLSSDANKQMCDMHLNKPTTTKSVYDKEIGMQNALTPDEVQRVIRDHTWLPLDKLPPVRLDLGNVVVGNVTYEGMDAIFRQKALGNNPGPAHTMKYELLRLCTLRNYPNVDKPYLIRLAASGFYYANEGDEVVCYCCGIRRNGWTESDVPDNVHKRLSPTCIFFTRNSQVNYPVPRQLEGATNKFAFLEECKAPFSDDEREDVSNDYTGSSSRRQLQRSEEVPVDTSVSRMSSVYLESPNHPHYAEKSVRLNSYVGWPDNTYENPSVLAEAGFYFAGIRDCVRCFICGVGLRHWAAEDNPWIEHARWAPTCSYLRQYKGEEFIHLVHMAIQISKYEEPSPSENQPYEETTRVLTADAVQSMLEMGYDARIIRKAIDAILGETGLSGALTAQQLMEKVLDIEDQEQQNQGCEEWSSREIPREMPQLGDVFHMVSQATDGPQRSVAVTEVLGLLKAAARLAGKTPKQIKEENEKLKERTVCKICTDRTVCIVFLPCGHLITCAECASSLRECPICKTLVNGTVKANFTSN